MIENPKLIEEFKKLLYDPYVYYCGSGFAFEQARQKTVEILYNIPFCFSILGILVKHSFVSEVYMKQYIDTGLGDAEFIKKYKANDIVYKTKDEVIACVSNDKKTIKFQGIKEELLFDGLVFDFEDNNEYKKYSNKMLNILKSLLFDEDLAEIIKSMERNMTDWKNKDDLYNMMY